jgi:glycosyltransferase involved in cell wall biosynthesis
VSGPFPPADAVPRSATRVLLDATAIPSDRGGVGRYVDGLAHALDAIMAPGTLAVVCQRADAERFEHLAPNAWVVRAPAAISRRPARLAWEQTGLPAVVAQTGAQVLHSPHYTMPLRAGVPVVGTLHDATFFTEPEMHTTMKGVFFRSATWVTLRRAARVIVPSKATRDELVRVAGADPTRIDVAYHGVDHVTFRQPTPEETKRAHTRLGIQGPYVAFLGTLEPRKNVPALIRGWVKAVSDSENPPALVLAGGSGWDDQVDAAVAQVPAHLQVIRPGYLHLEDLPGYLGGAELVTYPSVGEGFGLPVLEAMACGAAVLTTPRLSLPEVGGDAVAYTEPDEDSIANALRQLLPDQPRRAKLAAAGLARSHEFSWQASAEAHVETYARALGQ